MLLEILHPILKEKRSCTFDDKKTLYKEKVNLTLDQIFTFINSNDFEIHQKENVMHSLLKK